jgi:PhzF family phenazine biosynthesis protein
MTIPLFLVDAFAERPFSGNPAAVCLPPVGASALWMQAVAGEMNQAETAFVVRRADGDWDLRWFTPIVEVDLCGHATLAAAQVLWDEGLLPRTQVARFHTRSGVLTAAAQGERIVLDFPAVAMTPSAPPEGLIGALGVQPLSVWRAGPDLVIEAHDAATVEDTRPDFAALAAIPCRGVAVTAAGQGADHVVSRFFAPASGIPEDAVTGSLHCALGPYWSRRLRQPVLRCRQASARGGLLEVEPRGDRVLLGGTAVTVLEGRLRHSALLSG